MLKVGIVGLGFMGRMHLRCWKARRDARVVAAQFLGVLEEVGYAGAMAIEREGGEDRFGDIKLAVERLTSAG